MKKVLALIMAIALLAGAVSLSAMAEGTTEPAETDATTAATVQNGNDGLKGHQQMHGNRQKPGNGQTLPPQPGNNGNGQMPWQPDQNNGNGQTPRQPGQDNENGQMPQQPDQNNGNGQMTQAPGRQNGQNNRQMPGKGNRNMKRDRRNSEGRPAGRQGKMFIFDQLLNEGVITQEVYDAIMNYLKVQMAQQPGNDAAPAEEGSVPPALPEGSAPADESESATDPEGNPVTPEEQLLKELLDAGIITQEQYELILSKLAEGNAVPGTADSI